MKDEDFDVILPADKHTFWIKCDDGTLVYITQHPHLSTGVVIYDDPEANPVIMYDGRRKES